MKKIYLFVLLVAMAVALNTSCSEQADFPKLEDTEITAKFDVKLAKEAFVRDYTAAVEARSETTRAQSQIYYTLADTDYTPLWDKATTAENEHVLSIDVPLYSVSGAFVSDTDGENMRMATQKLIVIQSKKSGDTFSYLLTLCPDVACAEKYSNLNDVFTHLGDCSKFSGLAIYTSLAGELVAVDKFVNGVETGYVYVGNPEADQHAVRHQAEHLMEGMKFYLSSGPVEMTRGGGEGDTIYEDLCERCLSDPCMCPPYLEEFCVDCGEHIGFDGKCLCDYFEGEDNTCNFCGKVVCECPNSSVGCPKCGDITCTGCEGNGSSITPPNNPTDPNYPDDDICEYCNYHCGGTCDAYCPICNVLKDHCDAHRCASCGKVYSQCKCK